MPQLRHLSNFLRKRPHLWCSNHCLNREDVRGSHHERHAQCMLHQFLNHYVQTPLGSLRSIDSRLKNKSVYVFYMYVCIIMYICWETFIPDNLGSLAAVGHLTRIRLPSLCADDEALPWLSCCSSQVGCSYITNIGDEKAPHLLLLGSSRLG